MRRSWGSGRFPAAWLSWAKLYARELNARHWRKLALWCEPRNYWASLNGWCRTIRSAYAFTTCWWIFFAKLFQGSFGLQAMLPRRAGFNQTNLVVFRCPKIRRRWFESRSRKPVKRRRWEHLPIDAHRNDIANPNVKRAGGDRSTQLCSSLPYSTRQTRCPGSHIADSVAAHIRRRLPHLILREQVG